MQLCACCLSVSADLLMFFIRWTSEICTFQMHVYTWEKRYIQEILSELMRKLHLQFKEGYTTLCKNGEKSLSLPAGGAVEFVCACTRLCSIPLSVVSIYACMCKCSPYSKGRCVSHPWGRQSGRESSSSRHHTLQRSRRGRRVCSWGRHGGRCRWWLPAGSADTQSAPVRSGTFLPAVRSQWWLLLEEPGRSLCGLPCGQSGWDQDPSALASGMDSDREAVGKRHLVVVEA